MFSKASHKNKNNPRPTATKNHPTAILNIFNGLIINLCRNALFHLSHDLERLFLQSGGEGADDRKLLSTKTAKNDIKKLIKDKLKQCDRLKDVKRSIKSSRTKKNYGAV